MRKKILLSLTITLSFILCMTTVSSDENSNMKDELASGDWLIGCQYKKINDDKYVYLYFNKTKAKVVEGDNVLPMCERESNFVKCGYQKFTDIQASRLLEEYNNNGGCPINIYANTLNSNLNQGNIVYSLDRLPSTSSMITYVFINSTNPDKKPTSVDSSDCEKLLGDDIVNFINEIMKWIRIFVPILLIGLGILDFTKATFSKSEDDMKKSREKFIKRIIAAVLVFLVPMFINFILDLANSVWSWINPETCIK